MDRPHTTLYLRNMPLDVVREAKASAARRGLTLAELITEAIERQPDGERQPSRDLPHDELAKAMEWYERNRASVLRAYAGEYVAIHDGGVVDHDPDFETLATRVFARHGVRAIFMPRVERGERRVRVPSPRRVRA